MRHLPAGVADLHVDLPHQVFQRGRPADLSLPGGDVGSESLRAGCVRLLVLSLFLPSGLRPRRHRPDELLALLESTEGLLRANPEVFAADRVRVVYGVEGSQALAGRSDLVPTLVERGVRLFGPVHAYHNDLADSATDPHPGRGGLTAEGERFVGSVYEAGALVDVSHLSDEAFWDVARIAREAGRPLVATHSSARALADHPRNLTDAQLRAVAESGGLVGLAFHSPFLVGGGARATIADVVRHAKHMALVMGPEHVAIGSDLDGQIRHATGLESHAGIPALVRALCTAGISGRALRGLLGENAARLLGSG